MRLCFLGSCCWEGIVWYPPVQQLVVWALVTESRFARFLCISHQVLMCIFWEVTFSHMVSCFLALTSFCPLIMILAWDNFNLCERRTPFTAVHQSKTTLWVFTLFCGAVYCEMDFNVWLALVLKLSLTLPVGTPSVWPLWFETSHPSLSNLLPASQECVPAPARS